MVVLASVPCYGPLDGGLKLEDGQKLVGEGADPTAVGNVNKAWITNTTDRLDGSVLVTEGDNEVNNLLIGEEDKRIKGKDIINANESGNLTLCNLKIVEKREEDGEGTVLNVFDNYKDGSIVLNCVESTVIRHTGIHLSTKGKAVKYLCVSYTKLLFSNLLGVNVVAKNKSEISIRLDNVKLGSVSDGAGLLINTENDGTVPEILINESSIQTLFSSIIYLPKFSGKCDKSKGKLIITKSITSTVFFNPQGKADLLLVLKDNQILSGAPIANLTLTPDKDINLRGSIKRNVIFGGVCLEGGKVHLKLYDNKITSINAINIENSETLKLTIKAQNNTISATESSGEAIKVGKLTHKPILDFGGGKLNSKGHNSILVNNVLITPNAVVNSNGFVAQKNWWGVGGPNIETGPGVTVDVSKPLLKPPQQFCDC